MKKLVVFSNDPVLVYYNKGEIKARYFNPGNYFDEVHIISLCNEEVEEEKVQEIAGEARLKIYRVGTASRMPPWSIFDHRQKVLELVRNIAPNAIRGFNLCYVGYLAVYCARQLGIPSVVSIHGDYSRRHNFRILGWDYLMPFVFSLLGYPLERYIVKYANLILGAYKYALEHVKRRRKANMQILYNKVYTQQYDLSQKSNNERPVIISVGRHIKGKNPENLIRAIKDLDVTLLLIGQGELTPKMKKLAEELGISDKVRFIDSVPNSEIHRYYLQSDIFALSIQYGGIAIPVIEAMAAALPIVLSKPIWEKEYEVIGDAAILAENTPDGFKKAFVRLLADARLMQELGKKARKRAEEIDGEIMEAKEVGLYRQLIEGT